MEAPEDSLMPQVSSLRLWEGLDPMLEAGNQGVGQIFWGDNGISFAGKTQKWKWPRVAGQELQKVAPREIAGDAGGKTSQVGAPPAELRE